MEEVGEDEMVKDGVVDGMLETGGKLRIKPKIWHETC